MARAQATPEAEATEEAAPVENFCNRRTFRYHPDHPDGVLFDVGDVDPVGKGGWVDTPAKLPPRHNRLG